MFSDFVWRVGLAKWVLGDTGGSSGLDDRQAGPAVPRGECLYRYCRHEVEDAWMKLMFCYIVMVRMTCRHYNLSFFTRFSALRAPLFRCPVIRLLLQTDNIDSCGLSC